MNADQRRGTNVYLTGADHDSGEFKVPVDLFPDSSLKAEHAPIRKAGLDPYSLELDDPQTEEEITDDPSTVIDLRRNVSDAVDDVVYPEKDRSHFVLEPEDLEGEPPLIQIYDGRGLS